MKNVLYNDKNNDEISNKSEFMYLSHKNFEVTTKDYVTGIKTFFKILYCNNISIFFI